MPSDAVIEKYGKWYKQHVRRTLSRPENRVDLLFPKSDLYRVDHNAVVTHETSHLWRFRPSALVIELDSDTQTPWFHVMIAVSNAIALKDVGELNCYTRIMGARSGCLVSPKGISNEVRLVQAEFSIRNRLFGTEDNSGLFLVQWDSARQTVLTDSVIPIEKQL